MGKPNIVYHRLIKFGRGLAYTFAWAILSLAMSVSSATPAIATPNDDNFNQIAQIVHLAHTVTTFNQNNGAWNNVDSDYSGTTIVLLKNGKVYSWGNNIYGGVGNDTICAKNNGVYLKQPPCYYDQPQDITKFFNNDRVIKLTNQGRIAVAITESGKLYYWGNEDDNYSSISPKRPTLYQKLAHNHIIGFGGTEPERPGSPSSWCAHDDNTVFCIGSLLYTGSSVELFKPQLGNATIRQVDYLYTNNDPFPDFPIDKGGAYVLTSTNKLLRVQNDGTTSEISNSKITERGGIKQIHHHYAIDNQGGLWFYGYVRKTSATIIDMSTMSPGHSLPVFREFVNANGLGVYLNRPPIILDVNGHFNYLARAKLDDDMPDLSFKPVDVTGQISQHKVRLFHGDIDQRSVLDTSFLHDYSFVIKDDNTNLICTSIQGAAHYNFPHTGLLAQGVIRQPKKRQNNALTCVKLPTPDPAKPPVTPTKPPVPGVPSAPNLPGVPNTGQ